MTLAMRIRITRTIAPDELGEQIEPHMRKLGNAMGKRAQRLVPKRTYALHDSIRTETIRAGAKVTTTVTAGGGDVDYALYVERGTSRMGAQPYLRPALHQSTPADLRYSGSGPETIGVRRQRARERRQSNAAQRAADRAEHASES